MNSLQTVGVVVFWISSSLVLYAYLGYPLVVWTLARLFGRKLQPPTLSDEDLPFVSLLIAAYNEEDVIERRIQSALAMDYPQDKLEIVVASDGSSDHTAEIVQGYAYRGVRLLD